MSASHSVDGANRLIVTATGVVGSQSCQATIIISPPAATSVSADVSVSCVGDPALDEGRGTEAFRVVNISSMHVSDTLWDTSTAVAGGQVFGYPISGGLIIEPPVTATVFGATGGTSAWKQNAPTIEIRLQTPFFISGFLTASNNPNDDNVGLFAGDAIQVSSYSYMIAARRP
jgi:hypothetical protein